MTAPAGDVAHRLTRLLAGPGGTDDVLEAALAALREALALDSAVLLPLGPGGRAVSAHVSGEDSACQALVRQARQVESIPDLRQEPLALEAPGGGAVGGFSLYAPLLMLGRVSGALAVARATPFAPAEAEALRAAATVLAGAVDSARLGRVVREQGARAEVLHAVADDLGAARDPGSLLEVLARRAGDLGGGEGAVLFLEDDGRVSLAASQGPRAREVVEAARAAVPPAAFERGPTALAADEGSQLLVVPVPGMRAALAALRPVGGASEVLPRLEALAQRASLALAQARAQQTEGRRIGQLEMVSAASQIAASSPGLEALGGGIALYVHDALGHEAVGVWVLEGEPREAVLLGTAGDESGAFALGHRLGLGEGVVGWVARTGEAVLSADLLRDPRFAPADEQAQSELAVPVRLGADVVAVIEVRSARPGAFDRGDLAALEGVAAQVAWAVRNAADLAEKGRALRNLEILQEITNVLNSGLELDALLATIARRSVEAVGPAEAGAVLLCHEGALVVRSSHGYGDPGSLQRVRLALHEGLPGSVFVSGEGRVVRSSHSDLGAAAEAFRDASAGRERTGALCVPVSLPEAKLGVLLLESLAPPAGPLGRSPAPGSFEAADLRFATTLAHQAALAIGNALRVQRVVDMDRQRRDYLSNVSHELRTPLTVVLGYLEALDSDPSGARAADYVRVALDQARRLGQMIDEVLEVSALEQGLARRHVEWSSVRLQDTARRVAQALRHEAATRGVELAESLSPDLVPLRGDPRLLHLLVLNLLENALKFTPRGGHVQLEVTADGGEAVLRVRDDGIGIAPQHHERIFEKFYTVDSGRARCYPGAGIGLFLVREVVALHDGRLRVESAPGTGTTFEARLPIRAPRAGDVLVSPAGAGL